VRLRVTDVRKPNDHPRESVAWKQKKTKRPVKAVLSPYTQSAICCWIATAKLSADDFLFTARHGDKSRPLSTSYLRRLVKKWAAMIGLDPEDYSGHSLRRSKPAYMYSQAAGPSILRLLLGHQSLQSTQEYLGIDQNDALKLAKTHDCFQEK